MENNNTEMQGHLERNASMWKIWEEHGVNPETELTVNFHFYSSKKHNIELLCKELIVENIKFEIFEKITLVFFKSWEITADVTRKWSLIELQEKTKNLFNLSKQVGVTLNGCGAKMPK